MIENEKNFSQNSHQNPAYLELWQCIKSQMINTYILILCMNN